MSRQTERRSSASTSLESFTPRTVGSPSRITQAATTGPARQPRPTSSVPAMQRKPESRSLRSIADISATRASSANRESYSFSSGVRFLLLAPLFDARGFAAEIPEVVELCTTDPAMAFDLDLIDRRRIQREHALDSDAAGDFTNGEHLPRAAALARNDHTLEHLDALFVAFVDFDGVAGTERRNVRALDLRRLDEFHNLGHD